LSEDIDQDVCFLKEVVINAFLHCNAMKNGATPRSDACGANGEFIEKEDSEIDNSDLREKIIAIKRSRVEEKLRPYMIQAKENSTQIDELPQAPSNDLPKESTELEDMDIDEEQSDDSDVQCLEEETPVVDACGTQSQYFLVRSAEKMTPNPGLRQTAKSQKRRRHRIRSRATARGETPHWIVLDPATKFRLKVVKPTVFEPADPKRPDVVQVDRKGRVVTGHTKIFNNSSSVKRKRSRSNKARRQGKNTSLDIALMEGGDDTIGESLPQPVKCNNSLTTKFCWKRGEELISESDEDPVNLMSKLSGIKFNLKPVPFEPGMVLVETEMNGEEPVTYACSRPMEDQREAAVKILQDFYNVRRVRFQHVQ